MANTCLNVTQIELNCRISVILANFDHKNLCPCRTRTKNFSMQKVSLDRRTKRLPNIKLFESVGNLVLSSSRIFPKLTQAKTFPDKKRFSDCRGARVVSFHSSPLRWYESVLLHGWLKSRAITAQIATSWQTWTFLWRKNPTTGLYHVMPYRPSQVPCWLN